jgi:NlpC/P60 family
MATPTAAGFLHWAQTAIGDPYTWGGASPATGFDCSGLVQWALSRAGVGNVPRTSEGQYAWVQRISFTELRPGDLIFEQWPGDNAAPGHVAIFTGTGKIEEAPQPGEPVHEVAWSPGDVTAAGGRIVGYGRVPGMSGTGGGGIVTTAFPGSGLLSWPSEITSFFSGAANAIDWLIMPSHQIRILCGAVGTGAVGAGVFMLSHVGGDVAGGVGVPRAASLPLGILLVGTGGVLLFVAFHNLPANQVSNFPELIGWMIAGFKGDKSFATPSVSGSGLGGGGGVHLPALPPPLGGGDIPL